MKKMTKELLSYIPKVYRNSIIDFYKDQDGYWLSLKTTGEYILQGYYSDYLIHEDRINDVLKILKDCTVKIQKNTILK